MKKTPAGGANFQVFFVEAVNVGKFQAWYLCNM
jgi:hypothetical protein